MRWLLTAITTGTLAFAATNIDDILLLTLFFTQASKKGVDRGRVVVGQYLGFIVLVAISLTGYLASFVMPREWIRGWNRQTVPQAGAPDGWVVR